MTARVTARILLSTMLAACAVDESPTETSAEQELGPAAGLGDINFDGVVDGQDAVDYITAWGIQIDTYQLVDDSYNPGNVLARRPYDWQVKVYGDPCLPSGVSRQQFPPNKVPHIMDLANQLSRLPTQYLRRLGQLHYRFIFAGELGRLFKRWHGSANGQAMDLVLFHGVGGPAGKGRFGTGAWETIDQIAFDSLSGQFSFRRPGVSQVFSGQVDAKDDGNSIGSAMSGTFTYLGGTYNFSANASYRGGGTTTASGFGLGPITQCNVDQQLDGDGNPDQFTGTWSIGQTPPAMEIMAGGIGNLTTAHEVGHTLRWLVTNHDVGFLTADSDTLESLFPEAGDPAASCTGCDVVGTGYIRNYSASNGEEDFADTWGYYVADPNTLDSRLHDDLAAGSTLLDSKRVFLQRTIDTPDPGVAAAVHPATGQTYHFVAGNPIRYSIGAGAAQSLPSGGISRMGLSAIGDAGKLWLFATGTDGIVYMQSIDSANHFSGFRSLGVRTDLPTTPVVVTPGVIALFIVSEAGGVGYRLYDSTTGNLIGTGPIATAPTGRPVAAAVLNGTTWLFQLDAVTGRVSYAKLSYDASGFHLGAGLDLGISAYTVTAAKVGSTIQMAAIDGRMRVTVNRVDGAGNFWGWHYDPLYATATAQPALDASGTLYIKGFDGKFYSHPISSTTPYVQLTGL